MATKMLIDASHTEETRVAVVDDERLEEFDFETSIKTQNKGNVYLARVSRVEPSLQAAFVDYGGNRQGFLAFNEIHPDYFQIPIDDRKAVSPGPNLSESGRSAHSSSNHLRETSEESGDKSAEDGDIGFGSADSSDEIKRSEKARKSYRIQEVIKRRQVLLVQVSKEERGTKGAAVTTYISLPGRYCVLMPNTLKGGGVSRKIDSGDDRRRLRSIVNELEVPKGMAVIIRTAGQERNRAEIKRDLDYLLRLWEIIRDSTLKSVAPHLIYEEANLIKRSIRDLYRPGFESILVQGDEGYRIAKGFMRTMMPSRAKLVQPYRDKKSLFRQYQIEEQLEHMHEPIVGLPSGGYLVINPTEALVAVDVNSGSATKERSIEETALRTNMEAAEAIARQMRLRDLAGLVVVDFIDMAEARNNRAVERKLREAVSADRARVQMGRISVFGLLEFSRQRLRPSLLEVSSVTCLHCGGSGRSRSTESLVMQALRELEEEGLKGNKAPVEITMPKDAAMYLLNGKRQNLSELEAEYEMQVIVTEQGVDNPASVVITPIQAREVVGTSPASPLSDPERKSGSRGRSGNAGKSRTKPKQVSVRPSQGGSAASSTPAANEEPQEENEKSGAGRGRPRRRGRRGGRRRTPGERALGNNRGDQKARTEDGRPLDSGGLSEKANQVPPSGPASMVGDDEGTIVPSPITSREEVKETEAGLQPPETVEPVPRSASSSNRRAARGKRAVTKGSAGSSRPDKQEGRASRPSSARRRKSSEGGRKGARSPAKSSDVGVRQAEPVAEQVSSAPVTEKKASSASPPELSRRRNSRARTSGASSDAVVSEGAAGQPPSAPVQEQALGVGESIERPAKEKRRKGWWQRVTSSK